MGSHNMTQLALWDDLSRNISFTKELSIAYLNSVDTQTTDVTEIANALKKAGDQCHETLEDILRTFLLPQSPNKGNVGNVTSEHAPNMNWGDNSGPLFSNTLRYAPPPRGELPSFLTNDFPTETRRSLSSQKKQGSRSPSFYATSPKQNPENNGRQTMRSGSIERQFLNNPFHNIETKRLRYRSRSRSLPHQPQPVYRSFIRSINTNSAKSPPKLQKPPQSEQQNNSLSESFDEPKASNKHLPIPLEKSRSRSKNRKSKSRDRSPLKRQYQSPLKSQNQKSRDSNRNRNSSSYKLKPMTTKGKYRKPYRSRSPYSPDDCVELSSRSRSPPSPRRRYKRSPRSRSPPSPIRRRRRSPRPYKPNNRKQNNKNNGQRSTKQVPNKASQKNAQNQQQNVTKPKQQEDSSNSVIPPPQPGYPAPRTFYQQPPRNFQPNIMYYGQPGHMQPPPPPPPRPPVPYFMPPPRPRMMPFPPYPRPYYPPN